MYQISDNVSKHTNVFDVLKERGFIRQATHEDEIRELLENESVTFYIGFDPTADKPVSVNCNNSCPFSSPLALI